MEFWAFDAELDAITEEALAETGGRMDAYQRLLQEKSSLDSFNAHLRAVERIYRQVLGKSQKPPRVPGDELIEEQSRVY